MRTLQQRFPPVYGLVIVVGLVIVTCCHPLQAQSYIVEQLNNAYSFEFVNPADITVSDNSTTQINIGFTFNFFGNPYTTCHIAENGFIQFGTSPNGGCCQGQAIPAATGPNNFIAAAWADGFPYYCCYQGDSYVVYEYETTGSAPNRKLIITFGFDEDCGSYYSGQIKLYEGTDIIEIHTSFWADEFEPCLPATQGIENSTGTAGYFLAGRNANTSWSVSCCDMVRFTPSYSYPQHDAGISYILNDPNCAGTHPIKAYVTNFGALPLETVTVNWTWDAVAQDDVPLEFDPPLANGISSLVTLGEKTFTEGESYDLTAWTENPNGEQDDDTSNDMLSTILKTGVKDTFTIGGTNPDFATFASAITFLTASGVCDTTWMMVRPGTYTEQLTIPWIPGAAASQVIFAAENGDSSSVILQFDPTITNRHVVKFNNAAGITWERMTLQALGTDYGRVFEFTLHSFENTIRHCAINGINTTSTSDVFACIYSASTNENNVFRYNTIRHGSVGIDHNYTASNVDGFRIAHNHIDNFSVAGIRVTDAGAIHIAHNTITSAKNLARGIDINDANDSLQIAANSISLTSGQYGINLNTSSPPAGVQAAVYNNMVYVHHTSNTAYGIRADVLDNTDVVHNTVKISGANVLNAALRIDQALKDSLYNNLFTAVGSGQPLYLSNLTSTFMDFNGYHYTAGILAKWSNGTVNVVSLQDWQDLTGWDTHARQYQPHFLSTTNLHLGNAYYNAAASPVWSPQLDIDGEERSVDKPDIGADEFDPDALDASVLRMISPEPICDTSQTIALALINLGLDTITEATVHWKKNGVTQTPVSFSVQLLPEGDTAHVDLAVDVAFDDIEDALLFWAEDLNGEEDMAIENDTLYNAFSLPLQGTYTIGGASPDYTTIPAAIAALEQYSICGPVTFLIRNGVYNTQFSIPHIDGMSATNTITFTSEALDSSAVTIQFNATSTANYTVQLLDAEFITFRHLGFKSLNTTNSNIFQITGTSGHLVIENCFFEGRSPTISSGNSYLLYSDNTYTGSITVRDNYFLHGTRAVFLNGNVLPALYPDSILIERNQCINQRTGGLLVQYAKDVRIADNYVTSNTTVTYSGIQLFNAYGANHIVSNKAYITQSGDGIQVNTVNGAANLPGECRVYNNMSSVLSGSAFVINSSRRVQLVFNSANSGGTTAGSHHAIQLVGGDSLTVRNNNAAANSGRAYSESFPVPVVIADYNNYRTNGTQLAFKANVGYSTLTAWQAATGLDLHSVSVNPEYLSAADLHTLSNALNGAATSIPWVTTDADGQQRNASMPDIGADEIGTELHDAGVIVLLPKMPFARGTQDVKAVIRNFGSNTISTASVAWTLNGIPQPAYNYEGSLESLQHDTVIVGQVTFNLNTPYQIKAWTSNPNAATDGDTSNDTLVTTNLYPAVSGTVVIGTTGELPTITTAVSAMNLGGVITSVEFKIQPGTYNEAITLSHASHLVCGGSVVFTSTTGNAADVIWGNTGTGTHTIVLNGADGITFRHLTIRTTINATQAIRFQNASNCHLVEHCIINGVVTTNTATSYAPVLGVSTSANDYNINNVFQYNTISNGSTAIYWDGFTGTTGLQVKHNILQHGRNTGVHLYRLKAPLLHRNTISSNSTIAIFKGIYIESCTENTTVTGNQCLLNGKRSYGIEMVSTSGTVALPIRIANNYINVGQGAASYGIYHNNCNYANTYYNTIRVTGGDNTGINIRRNGGGNIFYLNNILDNRATGKTMQIEGTATPFSSNYNAHYTTGTTLVTYLTTNYATLAAWQATGRDVNSIHQLPDYDAESVEEYDITNAAMNDVASPVSSVLTDIEDMPRHLTTPDIGCDEYNLFTHDVGLVSISYPHQPYPAGINTVFIKFINNGADTLTSMQVHWEVNGTLQPEYYWSGLLPSAGTYDSLDIGQFDFIPDVYHDIKVWVSQPNGVQDQLAANDTLSVDSLYPGLHGIYTIGGTDPDFETLTDAIDELNKGGAAADVIFNIRPGTYLDSLLIRDFPGSDCNRSVTFQSESNNRNDVLISNLGLDQHTIRLAGADGVIFQHLRIESVNPAFRHAVSLFNGAHCNAFTDNQITGYQSTSTAVSASVIHSAAGLDTMNLFSGNTIRYGAYGIYLYGGTTAISNNKIDDNQFVLPQSRGVYARDEQGISITSNQITANSSDLRGLELVYCHHSGPITGNDIRLPFGNYGIVIEDCDATSGNPSLIANNFIRIGGANLARGIYINASGYQRVIHNSVYVNSANSSPSQTAGLYASSNPSMTLHNNIFVNGGPGYAIYANNNAGLTADYNNYLAAGANLGYFNGALAANLTQWVSISAGDQHSLSVDPQFMADADLHISQILLNGQGLYQPDVLTDIDGDERQDPPDIGADEFDPSIANDAGVFMLVGPVIPFASGVQPITIALKNFGSDTLTAVEVRWLVNGIEQPPYTWNGSLPPARCDTVLIGMYDFREYSKHDLLLWTEQPNQVPDSTNVNDTLLIDNMYPALQGTYTIGGVLPDFNLFSQVEVALGTGGILDDVIFEIRDGSYAAQLFIDDFPRTSFQHIVTFTSEAGDSSSVALTRNFTAASSKNYTIRLADAHGIRFEHMTISSTKGRVIDLLNGTSDVEIRNCRITGVENAGAYGDYQLVQSATTTEDSITLEHNLFEYGDAGIVFTASAGDREEHIRITDNTFFNVYSDAIYCQYTDGLVVQNNRISSTISGSAGIVLSHAYNSPFISGNDIRMKAGTPNALQVHRMYGTASAPGRIENNYLYCTGGGTNVGIRQQYADYVNYNYNTVRIENAGSGSMPFYDQSSYAHIHIRNCIFANYTGGLAMHVTWPSNSQINSVNYTDLYSTGPQLLYYFNSYATLADLQANTNQNLLGTDAEPLFSSEEPFVFQAALNGTAQVISGVTTDHYGNTRHATTPDIGAVEFTLPAHDIGAKLLASPGTYCGLGNSETVTIRIQNYGANHETGFTVGYRLGENAWVVENAGASIVPPGGTVDHTFASSIDLSQVTAYTFDLFTSLASDAHTENDTVYDQVVLHIPALVDPVTNMIPVNNAGNLDKTVSLSWSPATHATHYDLFVWKSGDPVPAMPQVANLVQINRNYSGLEYGHTYNWKVVAKNSCNQMVTSNTQQFTVRNLPDLVVDTVIAPLTGYTGQPIEIAWTVDNVGTGGTQQVLWSDAVYLSTDATLNLGLDIYLGSVQNLTALPNGESYSNEGTFTIPNTTVGNYYVFVFSDRFSNVVESQNGNNWSRSAAVAMIELSPLPDLDVVVVVPSALAFSGQTINVLYTVENDGTAATGLKTWHDRIWLTTDPANPGEHTLSTISHTANLAPGDSYTKNLQFTVPNGIFGNYYVHVRTDYHNVVYEFAAESNNQLVSDTVEILLNPPSDLRITAMSMADTLSSDYNNPLTYTVTNEGAGPTLAGYWKDDLYISPAPVFNPNFNLGYKTKYHAAVVPSLGSYTKNEYSNRMLLPAGWYYVYGKTDSGDYEYEYNMESNNIYAYPTPVYIGNPDLIADQAEFPDTVTGTSPFTLTWKQINQGHGRYVYKHVRTRIFGSLSPVYSSNTALLMFEDVALNEQMSPLDTIAHSETISIPPQLSGNVYLHIFVDASNAVYESIGDTNNIYTAGMPVYVIPPALPDLDVYSFTIPDTVTAGIAFAVQYATHNAGDLDVTAPWQDDVYISFDPVWMPEHAIKLADIVQQGTVAAGDSIETSVWVNLDPQTVENVYYIYVHSDEQGNHFEGTGESNNITRSAPFYVKGAPVVDLVLDTIEVPGNTFYAGYNYPITWRTEVQTNTSPVIRTWKDYVYFSLDQQLDTLVDIRAGIFTPNTNGVLFDQVHPLIQADEIEIPHGLSGDFYLVGISDATLLHHDTIRTNNIQLARDNASQPRLFHIQVPPAPDLIIADFEAPVTAIVNQLTTVEVCITNAGSGNAFGPWENQLYLSADNTINAGDLRLLTFNAPLLPPFLLAIDSTVCITANVTIPQSHTGNFYLIARADPLNRIIEYGGEQNNITIREIEVSLPLPADLVVEDVTVPLEALAGDSIIITWKTRNVGDNPAYGTFREVIYLSPDTIWHVEDPIFGVINTSGYYPPQSFANSSLIAPVAGVTEGDYYAIVRTDVQQQIIEEDDENNASASLDAIHVDVKTLLLDSTETDVLTNDALIYYKIEILPGHETESMLITLDGDSLYGLNELYVKYESLPTRGDFDFGPQQASGGYQHVIVPSLEVGTYYIAGYCRMQNGASQTTSILATIVPFEIHSISPETGVKDKQVTVEIRGIKLDQTERFRLRRSDPWLEVIAHEVYVRSDNRVYATFDLTGIEEDTFQLDGVKANQQLAVAPEPFIVVASGEPDLQLSAFAPSIFNAAGTPSKLVINFINAGDADVIDAIVQVESPYGNRIAYTLEEIRNGEGGPLLEVPLHEPNGPPGIIRPGGSGTIEVYVWSTPGPSFVVGLKEEE